MSLGDPPSSSSLSEHVATVDSMDLVGATSVTPSSLTAAVATAAAATRVTHRSNSAAAVSNGSSRTTTPCGVSDNISPISEHDKNGIRRKDTHTQTDSTSQDDLWIIKTYRRYSRYMNSRARPGHAYVPTVEEHLANMFTHGVLVLPSVLGMLWMLRLACNDLQHFIALVYGAALFFLFTVSTVFHVLSYSGKFRGLRNFFHIGDRAVIYLFIAASYTPWLTLKDYNGWGFLMLWIVWISALMGIYYQYTYHEKYKWLETLLYVVLGVCPSVVCLAMTDSTGMYEMALGGSVYISGIVFFKCDGLIPFAHAIWHCFVTLGAVCHYQAVCKYLLGIHNSDANEFTS